MDRIDAMYERSGLMQAKNAQALRLVETLENEPRFKDRSVWPASALPMLQQVDQQNRKIRADLGEYAAKIDRFQASVRAMDGRTRTDADVESVAAELDILERGLNERFGALSEMFDVTLGVINQLREQRGATPLQLRDI